MKNVLILATAVAVVSASFVHAKRAAPKDVPTAASGKTEYRAPRDQMGCVEAWQGTSLIWRRQIYVVKYIAGLETDIQDVFIKTIELSDGALVVTNERMSEFRLDIESLEVKVLKGSLVEKHE